MGQCFDDMKDLTKIIVEETKEKLYKKLMKKQYEEKLQKFKNIQENEEFQTDNPNLVAKLKTQEGFEPLLLDAAVVLGKYMQAEMKEKNKDKPTEKMLKRAVSQGLRYYEQGYCCAEALERGLKATVETLLNTWKYGKDMAKALGINEEQFTEMRKNVNNEYLKAASATGKNEKEL